MNNPSQNFDDYASDLLQKRKITGTFRSLNASKHFIDFSSNDYLGIARSDLLHDKIVKEVEYVRKNQPKQGKLIGSTGSRLLAGNSEYYERIERNIADFHERGAALIFNSGYDANLGVYSSLPSDKDAVLYDELMHNSVRMGILLGRQQLTKSFQHNNLDHLKELLQESVAHGVKTIFVAVESVYSMDGDFAPLVDLCNLCLEYGACVVVDEAHGTGVFGEQGQGLIHCLGLAKHPALLCSVHTYGKALGVHGAAVLCSPTVRDYLINYARPLIYSTSLPLHSLVSISSAYEFQAGEEGHARRKKVLGLVDLFKRCLTSPSLHGEATGPALHSSQIIPSNSPIQAVLIPGNHNVVMVSQALVKEGFDVKPIRAPTVPAGTERLRVILHAHNHVDEVKDLAFQIRRLLNKILSQVQISELKNSKRLQFSKNTQTQHIIDKHCSSVKQRLAFPSKGGEEVPTEKTSSLPFLVSSHINFRSNNSEKLCAPTAQGNILRSKL